MLTMSKAIYVLTNFMGQGLCEANKTPIKRDAIPLWNGIYKNLLCKKLFSVFVDTFLGIFVVYFVG